MDNLTFEQRVRTMRAVRGRDTTPELAVRRLISALGHRYRLHSKRLPGCPDLVFHSQKKVIFVHGCFWHGHACRAGMNLPKSNEAYWTNKLLKNKRRDSANRVELRALGWKALTIWECQLRRIDLVQRRLARFLDQRRGGTGHCPIKKARAAGVPKAGWPVGPTLRNQRDSA
jgi:DNA mismatch endonuclease (patch repair protein)